MARGDDEFSEFETDEDAVDRMLEDGEPVELVVPQQQTYYRNAVLFSSTPMVTTGAAVLHVTKI